ncbi:hypothetical protein BDZ85DRAFT_255694 [Elsinoe ampelina]|uniref:Uncharacterized protein n=1 Tax=Elsinoe ampelina TaxID=302913 RepID=A0A6A6GRE5_9PEZI|nr:hypothetical protein BDZ85DRAFT_255694 [Elsinoe ampelina]
MRPSGAVFLPPRVALPVARASVYRSTTDGVPRVVGWEGDVPFAFFAAVVARFGAMVGGGGGRKVVCGFLVGRREGQIGNGEEGECFEGLLAVLSVFGALLGMGPL